MLQIPPKVPKYSISTRSLIHLLTTTPYKKPPWKRLNYANFFESSLYGVGISFNDNPLSLFNKYDKNPIIKENPSKSLYSTGHGCNIEFNNETYYVFHGREKVNEDRVLYVGKLHIDSIDNVYVTDIKQCKLI